MIECGLLSGLRVRRFQKPLTGIVIRGPGPNLIAELAGSEATAGFPGPDLFDRCAHSGHRLLHPLPGIGLLVQVDQAATASAGFR